MKLPVINENMAKRIQQSEIDYFTSRISSIEEQTGNPQGVEIMRLGNTTAFYIKGMPWRMFNSVMGLSHNDSDKLADIIAFYKERQRSYEIRMNPHNENQDLLKSLAKHNLYQDSFGSVLYGLPITELPPLSNKITILEVTNEVEFDHYAEIHCVGSGMSITDKHHFVINNKGLLNRIGWKLFLAYLNDIPAAVAVMHINNNMHPSL